MSLSAAWPYLRPASWRWGSSIVLAIVVAMAVAVAAGTAAENGTLPAWSSASAPASADALTPPVARLAERDPQRVVRVIVQAQPGANEAVRSAVAAAGGTEERYVRLINAYGARITAAGAAMVAHSPGVRAVSLDAKVRKTGMVDASQLATAYNQSVRSDTAWKQGYTGKGVGVAVIDTGIAGDLADFRVSETDPTSRVIANVVTNPAATNGRDTYGHGTHIAGLIAGNGTNRSASDPVRGKYAGAAPDANLIAVKADDGHGNASVLDVIDGLQFIVDKKDEYNIRVVNMSLSSSVAESFRTDPLDAAVESAWLKGIVVVVAAGNRGAALDAVSYAPGNDPWVISVGGVDDRGTKDIADDLLANWSSRGRTQDGYEKPDVLAPGARLVSTMAPGAEYVTLCPSCNVEGGYFRVGGTSMAAAVISGTVANLIQAHPNWTPNQIKGAIIRRSRPVENQIYSDGLVVDSSGVPLPAGTTVTSTVVGAENATDKVLNAYSNGDPTPANQGLPVNTLVNPANGDIDYTRTSWTRTSWTDAVDTMRTSWTRTSWTRTSWTRTSWTATEGSCTDFERTSWTRTSWTDADIAWAKDQCSSLLAAIDPTRTSWTRTSWTRTSWTSSFDK
jgi:serine protease AprX